MVWDGHVSGVATARAFSTPPWLVEALGCNKMDLVCQQTMITMFSLTTALRKRYR